MPILLKVEIDFADEFTITGLGIFKNRVSAEAFMEKIITYSKNDDEFVTFGTNYAFGYISRDDFEMKGITLGEYLLYGNMFPSKIGDIHVFGVMSSMVNAVNEYEKNKVNSV